MPRSVQEAGYISPWVCCQCGVCVALCPSKALQAPVSRHGYRYPTVCGDRCTRCGLCAQVCPGPGVVTDGGYGQPAESPGVYGPVESCVLGWAKDPQLRHAASSGGVVTALLLSLLETGQLKGAIVTDLGAEGCLARTYLARKPEQILGARGSKYMITSVEQALEQVMAAEDGPFAMVGLPCQVRGVRKALDCLPRLRGKIGLYIALFCAGTKDYRFRSMIARRMGLDASHLRSFSFRGGGWPGKACGTDDQGREAALAANDRRVGRVWSRGRLTPVRCLLCDDPLGAAADLAVGDPWHLPGVEGSDGASLVLLRTPIGVGAIREAVGNEAVGISRSCSPSEVCVAQPGILRRRSLAPCRIRLVSHWACGWRDSVRALPPSALGSTVRGAVGLAAHLLHDFLLRR